MPQGNQRGALLRFERGVVAAFFGEHVGRAFARNAGLSVLIGLTVADEFAVGIDQRELHAGQRLAGLQGDGQNR